MEKEKEVKTEQANDVQEEKTEKVDEISEHEKEIEQLKKQIQEQEKLIKEQNVKSELLEHEIPSELHDLFKGSNNIDGIKTLGDYLKGLKKDVATSENVGYKPKSNIQEVKAKNVSESIKSKLFG